MEVAINPFVAPSGGGASLFGGAQMQPSNVSFAQMMQGQLLEQGSLVASMDAAAAQQALIRSGDSLNFLEKSSAILSHLASLEANSDLDLSEISLEDLAAFLAGEENTGADGDLSSLMQALQDMQDLLRDLLDELPAMMAQENAMLDQSGVLSFAAIVEVAMFLRDSVANGHLNANQSDLGALNSMHLDALALSKGDAQTLGGGDEGFLQSLSDIDALAREAMARNSLTLSPTASALLKTMANAIASAQKSSVQSIDFEASEASLVLARADQPQTEQIDHTQTSQTPPPRPENQISTKFAAVLVQQVRQVDIQEGTTRIELSPRGLGSIEIEMRTNSDGSLAVVVRAENDAVLAALREERDLLAAVIGDAASGSLDFQEFSQEQSNDPSLVDETAAMTSDGEDQADEAVGGGVTQILNGPQLDLVT